MSGDLPRCCCRFAPIGCPDPSEVRKDLPEPPRRLHRSLQWIKVFGGPAQVKPSAGRREAFSTVRYIHGDHRRDSRRRGWPKELRRRRASHGMPRTLLASRGRRRSGGPGLLSTPPPKRLLCVLEARRGLRRVRPCGTRTMAGAVSTKCLQGRWPRTSRPDHVVASALPLVDHRVGTCPEKALGRSLLRRTVVPSLDPLYRDYSHQNAMKCDCLRKPPDRRKIFLSKNFFAFRRSLCQRLLTAGS